MRMLSVPAKILVVAMFALLGGACGRGNLPELGSVSGRITLDGNPVKEALIEFTPVIDGRPSTATSDSSGYYALSYKGSIKGARIGEHDVTMTTFREAVIFDAEDDPGNNGTPTANNEDVAPENIPGRPETIPAKYAEEKLRVTVEPGSNTINLELTSD